MDRVHARATTINCQVCTKYTVKVAVERLGQADGHEVSAATLSSPETKKCFRVGSPHACTNQLACIYRGKLARFRIRDEWTEKLNPELYLGPLSREAKLTIWHELVLSPRYLDHRGRASWKRLKQDHECVAAYPKTKLRNYYAQWKDGDAGSVEYHSLVHQQRLVRDAEEAGHPNTPFHPTRGHSNGNAPHRASSAQSASQPLQTSSMSYSHSSFADMARGVVQPQLRSVGKGTAAHSRHWHDQVPPAQLRAAPLSTQYSNHGRHVLYPAQSAFTAPASTQGLMPTAAATDYDYRHPAQVYARPPQDPQAHVQYNISIHSAASSLQDPAALLPSSPMAHFMTPVANTTPQASPMQASSTSSTAAHMLQVGAKAEVICGGHGSAGWSIPTLTAQSHHMHMTSHYASEHARGTKRSRATAGMHHFSMPGHVQGLPKNLQSQQKRIALPNSNHQTAVGSLPAHIVYQGAPPHQPYMPSMLPAYTMASQSSVGV